MPPVPLCSITTIKEVAGLKSLAKETAIYGLSSIVGRFLNYLLVPVYTMAKPAQSGGYGVVTNVYVWVALMLVLLVAAAWRPVSSALPIKERMTRCGCTPRHCSV